jgi:MFS family permease
MTDKEIVDISRLIDERGLTRFNLGLLACAFLIIVAEGYDLQAIGLAVPLLVSAWHVTDRAAVGPVLSATFVGGIAGALLFGAFGDRFGRKWAIVLTLLLFGGTTWLTAAASSLREMAILRFSCRHRAGRVRAGHLCAGCRIRASTSARNDACRPVERHRLWRRVAGTRGGDTRSHL